MDSPRPRRLAFELLEPKASPSALLLALAPLDEPAQRVLEAERANFAEMARAPAMHAESHAALLKFIDQNTEHGGTLRAALPLPTPAQAAAADSMMQVTDTDLRAMLISETLVASPDCGPVYSVIQY